jgi:glycosyltransferase involved in cell wall biosynthesis
MKIAIEISPQLAGKRGIGLYTENLIKHLALVDRENEYVLFTWFYRDYDKKLASLYCPAAPNFRMAAYRLPDSLISWLEWDLRVPVIRALLHKHAIDVYHSPGPRLPYLGACKTVVTIHDLIYEKFPAWSNNRFLPENRRAAKTADALIADSYHTRGDMAELYGIPPEKVEVIHLGVDTQIFRPLPRAEALALTAKFSLPEKFILDVGPFEPRRNTETLLRGYALAKAGIAPHRLVLVGRPGPDVLRLIADLGLTGDVRFISGLTAEELAAVYGLSSVFAHLSLYDGFGLSVLEAMACGSVPLISDIASLPEIGGDACLKLKNAQDAGECAQALTRLIADQALAQRLKALGRARLPLFTWESTARKTLACYKRAFAP